MFVSNWLSNNYIEIFGAITGILYVVFEIRQNIWLWPVGIITSGVYIWVFFTGKLYADMSLQGYYLAVSILGWYWWVKGSRALRSINEGGGHRAQGSGEGKNEDGKLNVTRLSMMNGIILTSVFIVLYFVMWLVLSRFTDSPVPVWDSFITSLSIIATWMLAKKIYEQWYLWIIVNAASIILFLVKGLYPTVILYIVYCAMSFVGLKEWEKSLNKKYH
jgi:nicotinamide mononucleotide transporter